MPVYSLQPLTKITSAQLLENSLLKNIAQLDSVLDLEPQYIAKDADIETVADNWPLIPEDTSKAVIALLLDESNHLCSCVFWLEESAKQQMSEVLNQHNSIKINWYWTDKLPQFIDSLEILGVEVGALRISQQEQLESDGVKKQNQDEKPSVIITDFFNTRANNQQIGSKASIAMSTAAPKRSPVLEF